MKQRGISPPRQRKDRLIRERVHDPYKTRLKLPEPTVCPECGAVFHEGRWRWGPRPAAAHEQLCQACRRIKDRMPAGFLTLRGSFIRAHEKELLRLARHQEDLEKAEHPLHRIIAIEQDDEAIVITTTDIHLPRRIGEALRRAFHGELSFHYEEGEYFIRVNFTRDD
ncbi:MAG: BCAM0308 family protein [Alphaproteobacteria bacterium]